MGKTSLMSVSVDFSSSTVHEKGTCILKLASVVLMGLPFVPRSSRWDRQYQNGYVAYLGGQPLGSYGSAR